jgi:serine/threonine-protein kinase
MGEGLAPIERVLDRYALFEEIAVGGMASVHLGQVLGAAGFSRVVAIKRLHPHFARDGEFVSMFLDEARLAARIRHPNVVATLDVVRSDRELFLVMEYVPGESLALLERAASKLGERMPTDVSVAIVAGALHGLHAAHEAVSEKGEPLDIVHRDVSPQNIIVGADGVARVLDFGIAKARVRLQTTREGQVKGKLRYMAPEQLREGAVSPRTDVYAAGVVLWELLTGERLFSGSNEAAIIAKMLEGRVRSPLAIVADLEPALSAAVLRALEREPERRFSTARAMAEAVMSARAPASPGAVADWMRRVAGEKLGAIAERVARIEAFRVAEAGAVLAELTGRVSVGEMTPTERGSMSTRPEVRVAASPAPEHTATLTMSRPALVAGRRVPARIGWLVAGGAATAAVLVWARAVAEPSAVLEAPSAAAVAGRSVASLAATGVLPAETTTPARAAESVGVTQDEPTSGAGRRPAAKPAAPDCSERTYRDKSGILRVKKECL